MSIAAGSSQSKWGGVEHYAWDALRSTGRDDMVSFRYIAILFMIEKLKDRILKFLHLDGIISSLSGYVETRVALVKLEIREEVAGILSRGLMIMLLFMIAFLCLLFLCIGLANYLNTLLTSEYAGYMIMALIFGLLLAILLIFRKSFFKLLERQFVEMIKQKQH